MCFCCNRLNFGVVLALLLFACLPVEGKAFFPEFEEHVINPEAGTGLAITVSDVNGDGKPDIVGVSSKDVAWYENPTWERHLIADTLRNSNVCIAAQDLDGDGLPEFALGADWQFMNTESGGALFLLHRKESLEEPWNVTTLLEEEPTLHRIQWADTDGNGKKELIVAPLKGIGSTPPYHHDKPVNLFRLIPPDRPFEQEWKKETIDESLHVVHNIWPQTWERGEPQSLFAASLEGVTMFSYKNDKWESLNWAKGNPEPFPKSGAGEVKTGRLADQPVPIVATIEPWHGNQAVVYVWTKFANNVVEGLERFVLDDGLAQGHAVWWSDFDRDGEDELLIGFREKAPPKDLP
ncbi:MAG: VCBS repeat-containing protein, partial [Candidatus Omnitrophica bacterium]|nr:VCBS repeat-containing protein [Candidatus Omnitrophota bacterium]